jgi:hypothetical protein
MKQLVAALRGIPSERLSTHLLYDELMIEVVLRDKIYASCGYTP